jgi:nucleolar protein 9
MDERLKIAHNATASRVYDALLESPTVSATAKRQFVMDFIGHYHLLVDDRIGSRVGDRCWSFADTYLKVRISCNNIRPCIYLGIFQEKIGRSLVTHEQVLAASYYGKFFARNLNLSLLQRRPDDWRNMQADRKRAHDQSNRIEAAGSTMTPKVSEISPEYSVKRKRHARADDEIDALFNASFGKKIKKAAIGSELESIPIASQSGVSQELPVSHKDRGLERVLGAIRAAPKDEKLHGKKKHK